MGFITILEAGRGDFLDATREISAEQACAKPTSKRWSVLECIEHVIAIEERHLSWISNGTEIPARRDFEKEMRLFTTIRSRLTKVEAADVVHPRGRFPTLAAAVAEFKAVRDRSVQLVEECSDALYSIGVEHPYFGRVNGAELIQLIDGHARRHAEQIRETCDSQTETTRMPR
jgi:DinB superfamily